MLPAGPIAPCWKQTLSCDLIRVQQKNNLDINDVFFLQYKNGLHGHDGYVRHDSLCSAVCDSSVLIPMLV